jgi:hypothetical protein
MRARHQTLAFSRLRRRQSTLEGATMSIHRNRGHTLPPTVPGVIHCAVLSELGNPILAIAPQRTMLVHIPYNDALILGRVWIGRIEVLVGDSCPAHPAFAGTVDDACVNLAEGGLDVIMESRADIDAGRPHLNVTDDVVRVARCADVEAHEVVELDTLGARISRVRTDQIK